MSRKPAEGSVAKRHTRMRLLANARAFVQDKATYETWLRHVHTHFMALVDVVGELELEHLWGVARADRREDEEDEDE